MALCVRLVWLVRLFRPPFDLCPGIGRNDSCCSGSEKRYEMSSRQEDIPPNNGRHSEPDQMHTYVSMSSRIVRHCLPNHVICEMFRFFRCQPQCKLTFNCPILSRPSQQLSAKDQQ